MKLDLHLSDRISVEASPRASDQIKAIPGSKYDAKLRTWHVPRTLGSLYALRATFGDLLSGTDELNAWAQARHQQMLEVLASKTTIPVHISAILEQWEE